MFKKKTHRIHEEIAVDSSIIFLHLLLKLCSCELFLHMFNPFILKEGAVTALNQQVAALIYKTRSVLWSVKGHMTLPCVTVIFVVSKFEVIYTSV